MRSPERTREDGEKVDAAWMKDHETTIPWAPAPYRRRSARPLYYGLRRLRIPLLRGRWVLSPRARASSPLEMIPAIDSDDSDEAHVSREEDPRLGRSDRVEDGSEPRREVVVRLRLRPPTRLDPVSMRRFFDRAFERFTMRKPVHAARPSSTFLAAALLSTFSFAIARGDIEVSPRALDFGEAGHGERIRRTLTLRNTGDEPIRIRSARASCGCTTLERSIDGQAIPPGTSLEVGVVMSSGTAIGSLEKHLDIELGDGRRVRVA